MPRSIAMLLCFSAVCTGTGIGDFRGASRLIHSMEDGAAELLVYANNANELGVFDKGSIVPLNLGTRLFSIDGCCSHRATPALSSDGRRIAYVRLASAQSRQETVVIYDLESKNEKAAFEAKVIWGVSWDMEGGRLAVVADRAADQGHNLYIITTQTQAVIQQTQAPLHIKDREYVISDHVPPAWNPAGTQLAVEVRSTGKQQEDSAAGSIVLWDIQANQFRKLSDGVDPAWSPNGEAIAFYETSRVKCFTIKADGSQKRLLFALGKRPFPSSSAPLFYPVVWSPDSSELIFHQWVDADLITDIYRLNLTTGKLRFIGKSELEVVNWRTRK